MNAPSPARYVIRGLLAAMLLLPAVMLSVGQLPDLQRPPSSAEAKESGPKLSPLLDTNTSLAETVSASQWAVRRGKLRQEWIQFLGEFPKTKAPLAPQFCEKEDLGAFTRQKVTYQIEEGLRIDAILLEPKAGSGARADEGSSGTTNRLPGIVLFHPTYSNHFARVVGLDRDDPERYQALQWAEHGFIVLAPRCFIYSELPPGYQGKNEPIYDASTRWMQERHPGWRGMTRMTWDGIRALDFMETLPRVDAKRLGVFGHSLGAKAALYVAAFDERVKGTVFSEGGIGMRFSNWDDVWYLGPEIKSPGFAREHHELLAMVAPRAFLLLAGNSADRDESWAFLEAALPVYQVLGAAQNLGWFNHGLGHRYGGEARKAAEAFLDLHLNK